MATIEATKGIIIRVETEVWQNARLLDCTCIIKKLAKEHGGTAEVLQISQTQEIVFVKFNGKKQEKKFLKGLGLI